MSINFHAFQSRGYLFEDFEAQSQQWRSMFAGYDPVRIAGILNLTYDQEYLHLHYYQDAYRLRLFDGVLEKKLEEGWSEKLYFNETMSIYHLLYYTKDHPGFSGKWVSNESLDPRAQKPRTDPLLDPFARHYDGRVRALEEACRKLGGEKLPGRDPAYQFYPFPQVPMQLRFWDGDEDFPAQVQILVDSSIGDYVHVETTGCMVSDLLEKLTDKK